MQGGQLLEGLQHIGHKDEALVEGDFRLVHDSCGASGLKGLAGIGISVELLSPQSKED